MGGAELSSALVAADRLNEDFIASFVAAPGRRAARFLPRHDRTFVIDMVLESDDWVLTRRYSDGFVA